MKNEVSHPIPHSSFFILFCLIPQYDVDDRYYVGDVNGMTAVDVAEEVDVEWGSDSQDVVHKGDNIRNVDESIEIHIAFLSVDGNEIYFVELIFYRFLLAGTDTHLVVVEGELRLGLQRNGGSLRIVHCVSIECRWVFKDVCCLHAGIRDEAEQQ